MNRPVPQCYVNAMTISLVEEDAEYVKVEDYRALVKYCDDLESRFHAYLEKQIAEMRKEVEVQKEAREELIRKETPGQKCVRLNQEEQSRLQNLQLASILRSVDLQLQAIKESK